MNHTDPNSLILDNRKESSSTQGDNPERLDFKSKKTHEKHCSLKKTESRPYKENPHRANIRLTYFLRLGTQ